MTSVTVASSVATIGEYAFYNCPSLKSVTLNCKELPTSLFGGNKSVKEVVLGDSVKSIGDNAFYDCDSLVSITIPNGVKSIGDNAFYGCSSLSSVVVPNSVESIGSYAFKYCVGLTFAKVGNGVASMGYEIFYGCTDLESVEMGSSVGYRAFYDCKKLVSVTLGNSVEEICEQAFCSCKSLDSLVISNSVKEIGERAFSGCSGLTFIDLGDSVETIRKEAFYSCSGLTSISIPKSMKTIGNSAFNYCTSLNTVILGSRVPSIGHTAFNQCKALKNVYCKSTIIPSGLGVGAFPTPIAKNAKLYVPETSLERYKLAIVWKEFGEIVPLPVLKYILDGAEYNKEYYAFGESIVPVGVSTKEGYTFSGWSETPDTIVAADVTVTGEFLINTYAVRYIVDGDTVATDSVVYNSAIVLRDEPTKEGYTFSGWSEIPDTIGAADIAVTGEFLINTYAVFYIVDGDTVATDSVVYNSEIVLRDEPTKEGYTFSGWSEVPKTMPDNNVIIEGTFIHTNISPISTDITININGNFITVANANNNSIIIYSIMGIVVERFKNYIGEEIVLDKGIYIICVGNKTMKIKL